jgi:photosystem I 4.8kDa protein
LVFVVYKVPNLGVEYMTAQVTKQVKTKAVVDESKPPYPFRTIVGLILLAGNFLVAAIYFHIVNP